MPDLSQYDPVFQAAGAEWNVNPTVLKAVAGQESGGKTGAVSPKGAVGLMQIMPDTAKYLGMTDPNDPVQSIWGAAKYLSEAQDKEKTADDALRYYHGGPDWRQKYGDESRNYAPAVGARFAQLSKAGNVASDAAPDPAGSAPPSQRAAPSGGSQGQGGAMTDEEFLKATAAPAAVGAKGAMPDADFLAATGAKAATPAPTPPDGNDPYSQQPTDPAAMGVSPQQLAQPNPPGKVPTLDDVRNLLEPDPNKIYGSPAPEGHYLDPAYGGAPGQIAAGMFSPFARDPKTGETNLTLPPALRSLGLGALDVLQGRYVQTDAAGNPLSTQLTPNALALAQMLAGGGPRSAVGREPVPPRLAAREAPLSVEFQGNALNPDAAARIAATPPGEPVAPQPVTTPTPFYPAAPTEAAPVSQTGIPQSTPAASAPGSVGAAATPAYEAIHTPAEEAAYRATAEGKKLLEPQIIGEPDLNQYIPGETANSAEREQTAKAARELKELGIRVPEASQMDKEAAQANNTARTIYAENTAKTPVDIANRAVQRKADIEADKATVFAPDNVKGDVDHEPIVDTIKGILTKPENIENDAVQAVVGPLLDRLQNPDGTAKILDPRQMWGMRQQIDRMMSKRMQSEDANLHYAGGELKQVSDVMDQQIEKVAPGYDAMIARYAEHSRAIDEMTALQGQFNNLRGTGQVFTYNAFQRFMKNVVDSRMTPSSDLNAYKAISGENMQRLWNLRDSLRRTASAKELAQAAGSDTMPNIMDALRATLKMGGTAGLHAMAGSIFGPGGNIAAQVLSGVAQHYVGQRAITRATGQMKQLLNPPAPLRVPPGQENVLGQNPQP